MIWNLFGTLEELDGDSGMTETLLLTGATGFIGSHLLEKLLNRDYKIVVLKRSFSDDWRISHILKNFSENIVVYDIDKVPLENIFEMEEISGIIHLATYYKKNHSPDDVVPMIQSNIEFPTQLLDLGVDHGIKFFINTGTFFEYDATIVPITENSDINSLNLYSSTKISFENILKSYSDIHDIKTATLRIFSPYGPRDNEEKLVPYLIINALKENSVKLSKGLQKLDFVYVEDITEAYIKLINRIYALENHETFNIGSGFPYSVREIVSILEEITDSNIKKNWGNKDIGNSEIIFSNTDKAKNVLDWVPKFSIHNGLKATISYYRDKYDL